MHFNPGTPLSAKVYHQFANEPIKREMQTNTAKDFNIALSLLLITAQRGFL